MTGHLTVLCDGAAARHGGLEGGFGRFAPAKRRRCEARAGAMMTGQSGQRRTASGGSDMTAVGCATSLSLA